MGERWLVLTALAFARGAMSIQFHAAPALALAYAAEGLSFAAVGALTGAYLLPGVAAALGGGWLGQRFGDIRTASWGLAAMTAAGIAAVLATSFEAQLAARFAAGLGAVGLNVMLGKMAGDWFQGSEDLPTAMGALSSSWPAGLGLSALALPWLAARFGLSAALIAPAVVCAAALLWLRIVWRPPPRPARRAPPGAAGLSGARLGVGELGMVLLAGLVWGVYNVGFIAPLAWGPDMLAAAGVSAVDAAGAVSFVGWAAIVSILAGGWLSARAVRAGWRDAAPMLCFALSAAALALYPALGAKAASPALQIALGLALGPAAATLLTLPVEAARAEVRALAMGVFLATYYAIMSVTQPLLGAVRDRFDDPAAPLYASAAACALCLALLPAFRSLQRRRG